ncbi:serine/threonine protein kinase [Myxococcota bacterium]|nr:serine/threonine protein kinase [Myxococcota bacterium]
MTALGAHPRAADFHALSPERILDAVEFGGRRCTGRFLTLNSYENRVYQLELEPDADADGDANRGPMVVGKFYRPGRWSPAGIRAEHAFLAELAAADVPVVTPLVLNPVTGDTLGEAFGILYALFPRVGGRAPEEPTDDELRVLGRTLARLHQIGADAPAPDRPRLTPETYGRDNLRFLLEHDVLPPEVREHYRTTVSALLERMAPLFTDVPMHRIHGDCHRGNLLMTPRGPMLLDFDDFVTGPAVQDVWMLVPSADAEGDRQRRVLVEAYDTLRAFDPSWLRLVEPLRALRFIHYATWIARRVHAGDPVFARTFPHFGTLQYWQREVQDLREQIARLDAAD